MPCISIFIEEAEGKLSACAKAALDEIIIQSTDDANVIFISATLPVQIAFEYSRE